MGLFSFFTTSKKQRIDQLEKQVESMRATMNNSWNLKDITFGRGKGISINERNAMTLSAVYAALNILSDTLNLPVDIMVKDGNNQRPVNEQEHPYEYQCWKLLNVSPNQLNTPSEWFKLMEWDRNIHGHGISYIVRNGLGFPVALRYVPFHNIEIENDGIRNWYTFRRDDGTIIIERAPLWDVFHVKAGINGSPLHHAKESLSFGKNLQTTGNEYFADGMTNKVVLSHPGTLEGEAEKNLKRSFDDKMKDGSTIVLEEGLKPYLLSITPEQSQFLQSREFSITEVSRWFNIPTFMLANADPTYSNTEQFDMFFVKHNVRPRVRMYEQEANWKLLGNDTSFFSKFNMNALLRADIKTRFETYGIAIQNRIYNPNEARLLENMNPYEGGDAYENPNVLSKQEKTKDDGN